MKTVFLLGPTHVAYRPAIWASYFMERSRVYCLLVDTCTWGKSFPRVLRVLFKIIHCVWAYLMSDIVVIQPMTHTSFYSRIIYRLNYVLRKKLIVDIYISSYETIVIDRKKMSFESPKAHKLKKYDRLAFSSGSPTVFLTGAERDYYTGILGLNKDDIHSFILPLVTMDRPLAIRPYLTGKAHVPTIAWWGREGNPLHGFENIAESCRILLEGGYNARFAFFGSGGKDWCSFVSKYAFLTKYDNVLLTKDYSFTNGKLSKFLYEETDLALGTFGDTKKAKTVLVNKVLDAASYGLPSLTQKSEGMLEFFNENETVFISEIDPREIARRISRCLAEPTRCLSVGDASRALAQKTFGADSFYKRLDEIL